MVVTSAPGVSIRASPTDVATGLLRFAASPAALRRWAAIVLGASSLIEFSDEFECNERADALKGSLWISSMATRWPYPTWPARGPWLHLVPNLRRGAKKEGKRC